MSRKTLSLLLSFALVIGYSCVSQKKAASSRHELVKVDSQLTQQNKQLDDLDGKRKVKLDQNQLDDTANARISKFIEETKSEIVQLHGENTVMIGTVEVNKSDWDRLRKSLSTSLNATKRINDKINFLTDLINRNMVVRLDQDVIFEPGQFRVSQEVASNISKVFEPVTREIDMFTQKYPDFPLSLVITAKGYADATDISDASALYQDLKKELTFNGVPVTRESLNKELSNLRAKSVKELFESYTKGKSVTGGNIKNILYVYNGKGEDLPDPKVNDYKVNDPRRRVVLLYWSLFPDY